MTEEILDADGRQLATVLRGDTPHAGITFLTDPLDTLQVGLVTEPAGEVHPLHVHDAVVRLTVGTPELLVVFEGMLRVDVGWLGEEGDPARLRRFRLGAGDAAILAAGTLHAVTTLSAAKFLDVRLGPYPGKAADKITED